MYNFNNYQYLLFLLDSVMFLNEGCRKIEIFNVKKLQGSSDYDFTINCDYLTK